MTMNRTFILNGFLIFLVGLSIWQSSLWVYDQKQDRRTFEHFKALQEGNSIFRWEFNTKTDLRGAYKLDDFIWHGGRVSGEVELAVGRVSNSDFWLNLYGKNIDALHHSRVSLRIYNTSESEIYFFHQQRSSQALHVSERIKTQKGWQVITLDLSKLQWVREDGFEIAYPFIPSSWGGTDKIVTLFGLSPIKSGRFEIDWLELESDFPTQLPLEPGLVFAGSEGELLNSVSLERNKLWLIEDDTLWRTLESDFSLRQTIQNKNPNALLTSRGKETPNLFVSDTAEVFEQVFVVFICLLFLSALLLVYFFPKFPQLILAQLTALTLGMVLFGWYQMILSVWMYTVFLIVLCFNFYLLKPTNFNYSITSPWQSWLSLLVITLFPMFGVLAMSSEGSFLTAVAIPALGYYVAWALVQQYIIVAYILPRLNGLVPKYSVVLSAVIFSYLHFPNFSLMSVSFVMGLLWYAHYQKYGNWYAIAISHGLLAVVFREVVPEQWRISGELGLVFLSKLGL